ncbi:cache domain-containing protein [Deltaproteobacteria bacterium TL4]
MKIHNRLILLVIASLTTILGVSLSFTFYQIKATSTKQLETFRSREHHQVEQKLMNYLDIAYNVIDTNYKNSTDKPFLEKYYGKRLINIIDTAESLLKVKANEARIGKISVEKAKSEAMFLLRNTKFDNGTGYVFIISTDRPHPMMLMHPVSPKLEGQLMSDPAYNTALGRGINLFTAMADTCENNGSGFVDYVWDKPTQGGIISDVPKLSYVRLFPEWQWIIGTGIYIDEAITDAMAKSKNDLKQMRYDNGTGYIFIISTDRPHPMMLMHPVSPKLEGQLLSDPAYNTALGRGINLFTAMADTCEKNGSGFVDYVWDKPTEKGLLPNVPKLSYAKLYKPLNWIIGTGVYIDDIDKIISENEQTLTEDVRFLTYKVIGFSMLLFTLLSLFLNFMLKRYYFRRVVDYGTENKQSDPEPDNSREELVKTAKEIGRVMKAINAILQTLGAEENLPEKPEVKVVTVKEEKRSVS